MLRKFHVIPLCFFLWSCGESKTADTLFVSIPAAESGLDFVNQVDYQSDLNIIEYLYFYNGGGVAIGDINNDGLDDIFFTSNQKQNRLFLNQGNLKFTDITASAGLQLFMNAWSNGVTMADVNADGFLDIYVSQVGDFRSLKGHNLLYINNGNNTFTESAESYGLNFSGFSTQASFFDYDRDGDLDMYLLNHAVHTPRSYRPADARNSTDPKSGDRLYRNEISEGSFSFTDVTTEAGIYNSPQGYGLGLLTSDVDGDGWIDIYVGNDFHENDYLYINQGDGSFKESLDDHIQHTSRFSMGVDIADVNGDNLNDIFTLDMLPRDNKILLKSGGEDNNQVAEIKLGFGYDYQYARNAFQVNRGDNTFSDLAYMTDMHATDWSWSVLLQDYDNDGLSDVFITNGIFKRPNDLDYINYMSNIRLENYDGQDALSKELIDRMPTLKLSNYFFKNNGNLKFEEVSESYGLGKPTYSNGAAYADLDNDGDLELVINNVNEQVLLYKNTSSQRKSSKFFSIELIGDSLNRAGIGSRITAYARDKSWSREVITSRGFLSAVSTTTHFGLGEIQRIDSVKIQWPTGEIQVEKNIELNSKVRITKKAQQSSARRAIVSQELGKLPFRHEEDQYNDYNNEPLIPHKLSTEGPAAAVGDVNGDGLMDIFVGGAHGQEGELFLKQIDGSWNKQMGSLFEEDSRYEDVDALFYDLDTDGDLDLYVVSGGNKFSQGDALNEDRIYLNDGDGTFSRLNSPLPRTNGSCVTIADFNKDGQSDIFVGGRSVPGAYGLAPISTVMTFKDGKADLLQQWEMGMVTDAEWVDYNSDSYPDLVVVGEWMPVTIFQNMEGKSFEDKTVKMGLESTSGWWNSLEIADLNNDGKPDLVTGNLGGNSKLKASQEFPVSLYLDDFDENEQLDPLLFYYVNGTNIPLASKDEIVKQLPNLKKEFLSYSKFAEVSSIVDLTKKEPAIVRTAQTFASAVFLNRGEKFEEIELPSQAQWSAVQTSRTLDLNGDGFQDLLLAGNFFGSLAQLGRMDAMSGLILLNSGNGKFVFQEWLPIDPKLEYRHIKVVGDEVLFISNDNAVFKVPISSLSQISQ